MTRYGGHAWPTDALRKKHLDKVEDSMIKRFDGAERKRVAFQQRVRTLEAQVSKLMVLLLSSKEEEE